MPAMAGSVVFDTVGSDGRPIVPIDTIWLFIDGWDVTSVDTQIRQLIDTSKPAIN
jgi:hypothetical protein